jgi:hypothetical protein
MKLSRQTTVEQKSMGLKRRSRIEGESEKSMCQRLLKQRAWLLRLREDLWNGIQQLTAEACEESPHYSMHMADAATDSFDRDLVLGLVSFEQEGLYEIDAALVLDFFGRGNRADCQQRSKIENEQEDDDEDDWRGAYTALNTCWRTARVRVVSPRERFLRPYSKGVDRNRVSPRR